MVKRYKIRIVKFVYVHDEFSFFQYLNALNILCFKKKKKDFKGISEEIRERSLLVAVPT